MSDSTPPNGQGRARFVTTQWTKVLSARGESFAAADARKELCEHYYGPVYAFVRSYTRDEQNARDLTHSFFAKLLEGRSLDSLTRLQGKFRSYLLGAVKHFLSDERAKLQAAKRGGLVELTSIELLPPSDAAHADRAGHLSDAAFDRHWALSILELALEELDAAAEQQGLADRLGALRPWLSGEPSELTQTQVAQSLGLTEGAVKVTIHRLRKQFRGIVKRRVAATLSDPSEVDEELAYLIQALAWGGGERSEHLTD